MSLPPKRSKQDSLERIARLKKQLAQTRRALNRLQDVLPLYLSLSREGWLSLDRYGWALETLEKDLENFTDLPQPW